MTARGHFTKAGVYGVIAIATPIFLLRGYPVLACVQTAVLLLGAAGQVVMGRRVTRA